MSELLKQKLHSVAEHNVLFCQLQQHRIIEEFVDRNILA